MSVFWKHQIVMFSVMTLVGIAFNPMNVLAFRLSDIYFSRTLLYGGLLMASNMIWAHEIVHYFVHGAWSWKVALFGVVLSLTIGTVLLRQQLGVSDREWLKRMISHHSTALTTSSKIVNRTQSPAVKKLGNDIIATQEKEIAWMTQLLTE